MNIVYSREYPTTNYGIKPSIFLAGPTPRSSEVKSWRPDAIEIIDKLQFNGYVFLPENRPGSDMEFDFFEQVEWEKRHLNAANIIAFWIPSNMENMPALTTRVEFGRYIGKKSKSNLKVDKVVLGYPETAEHIRYISWMYQDITGYIPHKTLSSTIHEAIELANLDHETLARSKISSD